MRNREAGVSFRQWLSEMEGDAHSLNRGNTFDQGTGYGNHGLPVRSKWQQKDKEDGDDDIGDEIDKPNRLFGFKGREDELLRLDAQGKRPKADPAIQTDTRRMMSKKLNK